MDATAETADTTRFETSPPASLTVWEAKERAGLIALETEEWREKRLIAEDPNTTADVLSRLADSFNKSDVSEHGESQSRLLGEAISTHPNTPINTLRLLFNFRSNKIYIPFRPHLYARAMSKNPVIPFITLEMPNFWEHTGEEPYEPYDNELACQALLREEGLPHSVVKTLALHRKENVAQTALLHIRASSEIQTRSEWQISLTEFWRRFCVKESQRTDWDGYGQCGQWHTHLVELGLAPAWAIGDDCVMPAVAPPVQSTVMAWNECRRAKAVPPCADGRPLWARLFPALADTLRRVVMVREHDPKSSRIEQILGAVLLRPNAFPLDLILAGLFIKTRKSLIPSLIVHHRRVTPYTLWLASYTGMYFVSLRPDFAAHPRTPPGVLLDLLNFSDNGDDAFVHRLICCRPDVPANVLARARDIFTKEKQYTHRDIVGNSPMGEPLQTPMSPYDWTPFIQFVANLYGVFNTDALYVQGQSPRWTERILAALKLPLDNTDFSCDPWNRSPLDLMHHLARDGNRFVRWAAQTRLADPDFVFTWYEE